IAPKNIEEEIELESCKIFLYRTLARIVAKRMPTKFIKIDRDRFTEKGTSRYKMVRLLMGIDDPEEFDKLIKDVNIAETVVRKEISQKAREALREGRTPSVTYDLDSRLEEILRSIVYKGDKDVKSKVAKALELVKLIKEHYSENEGFLNDFASFIRGGLKKYPFTFALEDTDISLLKFSGGGQTVIPRFIGDISQIEQNVVQPILNFPQLLHMVSIDGKHDFSKIIETIQKIKTTIEGIISIDYAHEVAHHLALMTINYFKKDTYARAFFGLLSSGRRNSLAAEIAGRAGAVWEWDSREIDAFCTALETYRVLPKLPYSIISTKVEYEPVYIKVPFTKNKIIKLPEKIFKQRKKNYSWWGHKLRQVSGGDWKGKLYDIINRYLPLVILFLLFKFIKDALEEAQGKKK
ncbi:MAG: hypothetical protein QHH09_04625, partial [Microgenomates group bacterium]|nr:hypothetical protein [Microgenomates group bacterium]